MGDILDLNKKISLKEASEISGYNPDYLSYLIRTNRLSGYRLGRNWFTTKEDLKNYLFTRKPIFKFYLTGKKVKFIFFLTGAVIFIVYLILSNASFYGDQNINVEKKLNPDIEDINLFDG